MNIYKNLSTGLLVVFVLFGLNSCSNIENLAKEVYVSNMFSCNMVLQRNMSIPIWGKATPYKTVKVVFQNQIKEVKSNADSTWQVNLDAVSAGGPYDMYIIGKDTISFTNILVGDVWVCSGQSNMEMPLAGWGKIDNYKEEIALANHPKLRLFTVDNDEALKECNTIISKKQWVECSPETVADFSASAYFFGKNIHEELNVPIGLIHSSVGGTPVEAWTPTEYISTINSIKPIISYNDRKIADEEQVYKDFRLSEQQWLDNMHKILKEKESKSPNYSAIETDDSKWSTMEVLQPWEDIDGGIGDVDGVVWFRRTFTISENMIKGDSVMLSIGRIHDANKTYINGKFVGESKTRWGGKVTEYTIPTSILISGKNTIAIQIENYKWIGGICGEEDELSLSGKEGFQVDLSGNWKYKMVLNYDEVPTYPISPLNGDEPALLYNGKINPIIPYAIKGVIWYQGEANEARAIQYRKLFPMMITAWRERWNQGDFPFLYVQLANYMERKTVPGNSNWAMLREAQTMALSLPNTGMTVAIDIGLEKDIHPKNKQEVGRRLALSAFKVAYDIDTVYSGPLYKSMTKVGSSIEVEFSNIGSGLDIKDCNKLKGFAIAGDDMKFKWANATIDGDKVIVWSSDIKNPVAVRYAWADNPECNLYNKEGLPAVPFRTDQ